MPTQEPTIIGKEARFAVFCRPPKGETTDYHYVKEIIHYSDGTKKPNLHEIKNFKRPFYITKEGFQNHKEKKEWEDISKLQKFDTTQSDLVWNIGRALQRRTPFRTLRDANESPYVYGSDILSTAIIKKGYQEKYGDKIEPTAYKPAVFDVETSMFDANGSIIMGTITYGDRAITVVREDFVAGYANVIERLRKLKVKYVDDMIPGRNINWEIQIAPTSTEIITRLFVRAHEWQPDYIAVWNITFDMGKVLDQLMRDGVDPKDVFSDPSVKPAYRFFKFKLDEPIKVTATGKKTPKKPSQLWNVVYAPASFYFVDAMCAYRQIRTGSAEEQSYGLDAILAKVFKDKPIRKLKFEEAEGYQKGEWHKFMQANHPLEYIVYNLFDCVSVELLDEKTSDLSIAMPMFSGCSDFEHFNSQPRRSVDNLHYFCRDRNMVIGSTSGTMVHEYDALCVNGNGWIVTLPAHLVVDNGLPIIKGMPYHTTNLRLFVADLDVSGSYPNGGSVFNVSRATTKLEIHRIEGVSEFQQRAQGINFSGGRTNAVEFCTGIYGMPEMDTFLEAFDEEMLIAA